MSGKVARLEDRIRGAFALTLPASFVAVVITWGINPWFFDAPHTFAFFTMVPLLGIGYALGHRLSSVPTIRRWGPLSAALFILAWVRPLPGPVDTKLVVVGIDGATWTVADSLELPHLDALKAKGKWGTLMAEEPLFSPLVWTTIATGKRPAEHGIRGFSTRSDHVRAARFWDIARDAGLRVGLYKWLVTWPPPDTDEPGFTVPAWLAVDAQTHPTSVSWVKELELSRRIQRKRVETDQSLWQLTATGVAGGLRWSTLWAGIRFSAMERISPLPPRKRTAFLRRLRVRIDRDVFVSLLNEHNPDVATFTSYATDALAHTHWGLDGGRTVDGAYRLADAVLGEIQAQVGPDATILVLSDHGFRNADIQGAHGAVPKTERLRAWLTERIGDLDIVRVGRKLVLTPLAPVDDARMNAVIEGLTVGETGEPLFAAEPLPSGAVWSLTVQVVPPIETWADTQVAGVPLTDLLRPARAEAGEHDPAGIVVLAGPGIAPGQLGTVSQLDVTPTILAQLGLPVGEDMTGTPWVSASVEPVPSHDHLAPFSGAAEDAPVIDEERLRALGYVE